MVFQNLATVHGQPKGRPDAPESRQVAEKKLVKAAKRGHTPAFAALCEQYAQRLFHTAHRITKSHQDAEDTVQDALLKAFVHLADFNEESGFGTWLTPMKEAGDLVENKASLPAPFILRCGPERAMSYSYRH